MAENGTKAIELIGIFVDAFPSWKGETSPTTVRCKDDLHKWEFNLPLPTTDEESMEVYNIPLADLLPPAVKNLAYRVNTDPLTAYVAEGGDPSDADWLAEQAVAYAASIRVTPREAGEKAKARKADQAKARTLDALMEATGSTSIEELMEKARKLSK